MYNLLVSGSDESWNGEPFMIEPNRYLEYTENDIKEVYRELNNTCISKITRFPCIFAYEKSCNKNPFFGLIQELTVRRNGIKIQYELIPIDDFLTANQLIDMQFELDISKLELNRTHWAIKNVNLPKELYSKNILLPEWTLRQKKAVDIDKHIFDVAFSFPGEIRDYIEPIVEELENTIGRNSYFYDKNYKAQLARPSLDILLQSIYKDRTKLIVVFLCKKYQEKKWCGIEFNAIRQIIHKKEHDRIMYVKMDDGVVDGVLNTDGYIDGRTHNPKEIAKFIKTRIDSLKQNNTAT